MIQYELTLKIYLIIIRRQLF